MFPAFLIAGFATAGLLLLVARKAELRMAWAVPWIGGVTVFGLWLASRVRVPLPGPPAVFQAALGAAAAFGATLLAAAFLFFRDPRRTPPDRPEAVLSPADGKIIYVKTLENGRFPIAVKKGREIPLKDFTGADFPMERGVQIGIMMSYLDVHINRAPVGGRVERLSRVPGGFHSLKHADSLLENERVFSVIGNSEIRVGIVQIASRLVRRIVPFVDEGDEVRQGARIGAIRFGSQVDLLLPDRDGLTVTAEVGDYVKAGLTILARVSNPGGPAGEE